MMVTEGRAGGIGSGRFMGWHEALREDAQKRESVKLRGDWREKPLIWRSFGRRPLPGAGHCIGIVISGVVFRNKK